MKTTAFAAALAAACSPAFAGGIAPTVADAPPFPAPLDIVASPARDWTGFYAGVQVGSGAFDSTIDFPAFDRPEPYLDGTGALAGVHLGYMRDLGRVVLGAELDYDTTTVGLVASSDWYYEPGRDVAEVGSIARAKLRVGYDAGRLLPYVTAGVARMTVSASEPWIADGLEDAVTGRFVGLGVAYAATDRLTLGLEALRHDFGGPGIPGPDSPDTVDGQLDTVTLRASWRF